MGQAIEHMLGVLESKRLLTAEERLAAWRELAAEIAAMKERVDQHERRLDHHAMGLPCVDLRKGAKRPEEYPADKLFATPDADPFAVGKWFLDFNGWVRQSLGHDEKYVRAGEPEKHYGMSHCTPIDGDSVTCALAVGDVVKETRQLVYQTQYVVLATWESYVFVRSKGYNEYGKHTATTQEREAYALVRCPPKGEEEKE